MKVPFLDLRAQYESIKNEVSETIQNVLDSTAFSGGLFVEKFEEEFSKFCGCNHCIGVGSGTEALWLTLMALGVDRGDEVITVPNTFIATAEAISYCGAKPVFVDIDEKTYNMAPNLIEEEITRNTKAIIPVHLFGQMADMDPIMEIGRKYKIFVIEDACQAHGAEYKGHKAGSIGDAAAFSFYPGKNLGAYGEAGAVVTNRNEIERKVRMLRDHGQLKKYYHDHIGWNSRMDGIQGAVLSVKLQKLEEWNESRRKNAKIYTNLLSGTNGIVTPWESIDRKHVYHIYSIRIKMRDLLLNTLRNRNIHCSIHYPVPIHMQNAYKYLNLEKGSYPVSEKCAEEIISLPMYPELKESDIEFVTEEIKKVIAK
jgi:dTDP-4-amino-4,6-dideoxygalactose transaminase